MSQPQPDFLSARWVSSPCCIPQWPYEKVLAAYRDLGFRKFEAFSEWAESRLDWRADAAAARLAAEKAGFAITSFHLPLIREDAVEEGLRDALAAARYAGRLGAKAVLFKAATREVFGAVGRRFLDALEREEVPVAPVLQNHRGSAITSLQDFRDVLASLGHDPRMKAVLEVGHFARVGEDWRKAWDYLGDRVALIHINDIRDGNSVLYGTGEVDFAALLARVKASAYAGDIVVELELSTRGTDPQATLDGLRAALAFLDRQASSLS